LIGLEKKYRGWRNCRPSEKIKLSGIRDKELRREKKHPDICERRKVWGRI
jgi:hypothetical protein